MDYVYINEVQGRSEIGQICLGTGTPAVNALLQVRARRSRRPACSLASSAAVATGTYTLQDSLMLYQYASPRQRELYLKGIVEAEISPSFAMTEPDVASSDPTQLQARANYAGMVARRR